MMSKEVVVYKNAVNKISLGSLNSREQDLFFTILYKTKNKGTEHVILDFDELAMIIEDEKHKYRIPENLRTTAKKLAALTQEMPLPDGKLVIFNLFNDFLIDADEEKLDVSINKYMLFVLNELTSDFTKFELKALVSMKSSYSKTTFRLLKQYQSTGWYEIEVEEFKFLLGVPESYAPCDFNKRVLEPIMKELKVHFPGLKLQKIKKGRTIHKLKFTWKVTEPKEVKQDELEMKLQKRLFEKNEKEEKEREQERSGKIWL